ncbi:unnamed protein product [Ambrosiozyma monospora]|uniref:Unnamed protein product n=1 Tax=Ambrosiozyma monospora TaxID=43982 RepID=A0ACB5TA74_AMBMO|nr:unnamed protein product [Ambrosiozyma monospora]
MTGYNLSDDEKDNYGSLDYRNIPRIQLGPYEFNTWFGNSSVFTTNVPDSLGYKEVASNNKKSTSTKKLMDYIDNKRPWLDKLFFCSTCFKYTDNEEDMKMHLNCCRYRDAPPGRIIEWYSDSNGVLFKGVTILGTQQFVLYPGDTMLSETTSWDKAYRILLPTVNL